LDSSLRHEIWPFLLHYFPYSSTFEEREQIRNDRFIDYQNIRKARLFQDNFACICFCFSVVFGHLNYNNIYLCCFCFIPERDVACSALYAQTASGLYSVPQKNTHLVLRGEKF